ncbi:uncharacterized protein CMU_026500 [Cryptosporidium muris RN66]|uniref:Uncharacterized protein n=1 Tax=Cryptosporidium muris (strain RN66) TaxID=441375 RepID=B6AB90_CRYMR|nr:uncharacterized protein CMU_026500 [Cryptosporidium muris RN66]EEA05642.1 hypothetical protein, conserved [Cryptosporidium muris RN66]|eukprot:XP_002139991.1 hypothetical protein [Cryptosporidium muris RN66]
MYFFPSSILGKIGSILLLFQLLCHFILVNGVPLTSISLSASATLVGGRAFQLMLTRMDRGTLGEILASRICPAVEDGSRELFTISTDKWDGESYTIAAALLYIFDISCRNDIYGLLKPKKNILQHVWGNINLKDPYASLEIIRNYLISLDGGQLIINLDNVEKWNLYPLAILLMINKKEKDVLNFEDEAFDTVTKIYSYIDPGINATKTKYIFNNTSLIDFIPNNHYSPNLSNRVIPISSTDEHVYYYTASWKKYNVSSLEELHNIYNSLYTHVKKEDIDVSMFRVTRKFFCLSLALVLFARERKFDIGIIEAVDLDISKFRRRLDKALSIYLSVTDIASLSKGKNRTKIAPWKLVSDEKWKESPISSFKRVISHVHVDEIRQLKYDCSKWGFYDFFIGSIFYFYSKNLGIQVLYGQYQNEISTVKKLFRKNNDPILTKINISRKLNKGKEENEDKNKKEKVKVIKN